MRHEILKDMRDLTSYGLRAIPAPARNASTVADRRARIIEACIEELNAKSFPTLRVEDVARRAGLDKRTLYDYIEKKEDLLLLVFGSFLPDIVDAVQAARDSKFNPVAQLEAMLLAHTEIITTHPYFVLFHYREIPFLPRDDKMSVLNLANQIRNEYERVFSMITLSGVELPTHDAVLNSSSALALIDMIGLYRKAIRGSDPRTVVTHILNTLVSPDWKAFSQGTPAGSS